MTVRRDLDLVTAEFAFPQTLRFDHARTSVLHMICVSIGRGRHKMMMAEHRHLAEQGVQLVELRLDYIRRAVNLKRLMKNKPCSVIATCRRPEDGGEWQGTERDRLMLLRTAIADGVDYVDLEEDVASQIPRFGPTKRIVSYHNFRDTPEDLEHIHERMCQLDCDIVKLATMAHKPADNLRMMDLMQSSSKPMIGLCMGEIGTPTRILAGKYGAPFTYATFHADRQLAPGQLTYKEMLSPYHYDDINDKTKVYGVIADPVGHSLSPCIHNAAFRHLNVNAVYVPFRVPREDLDAFLFNCRKLEIDGLSVTIPHKESVLQNLDQVDGAVHGIGAANTIVFEDDVAVGYNTDFHAAMDSIEEVAGDGNSEPLDGKTALVLGAGGVSKAIVFGLKRRNVKVTIASRTRFRSDMLAEQMKAKAIEWDDRYNDQHDLLINGTPVGMHPNVDETPYDTSKIHFSTIVFDTVYNPEQTLLVKGARNAGCRVVTGVEMFVRQAAMQFKLFTGQEPPLDVMREEIRRTIGAARH